MTTGTEDRDFYNRLFDQVSDIEVLRAIKEVMEGDAEWVLDWVRDHFTPGDVFDERALQEWADANSTSEEGEE